MENLGVSKVVREILENEEDASFYLSERWLGSALLELRRAFRDSGLTYKQVAKRMGVPKRVVRKCYNDVDGDFITMRLYASFMAACGRTAFTIEHLPTDEMRRLALINPESDLPASRFMGREEAKE